MATLILSYYADTFVDTSTLSKHYNTVINAIAPTSLATPAASMTDNVNAVITAINNTTGKFALAGLSYGAWVMSNVYNELRSGSLTARRSDFLGAAVAGNPMRQAGHTFPGGTDPGGHGIASTRLTSSETLWWEFAQTGDIIGVCADDTNGTLEQAVFNWIYQTYSGTAAGLAAAAQAEFSGSPAATIATISSGLYTAATWAYPHILEGLHQPLLPSDTRTASQIATDYLVSLAASSPSTTTVITLDGVFGLSNMAGQLKGAVTNGNTIKPMLFTNWGIFPSGSQFNAGVDDLNALILNTSGDLVVFGNGMGAATACGWLTTYGPTSTVSPSRLRFVLIGNPIRRYGGLLSTTVSPPPTNTPYTVLDIAREYDGWCDWPTLLTPPSLTGLTPAAITLALAELGTLAGQNAFLGMVELHTTYSTLDIHSDEYYQYAEGNYVYRLYTTYPAPIVQARNPFALAAYISQQDSQMRPLVEDKYLRPMPVPTLAPLGGIASLADSQQFWENNLALRATKEAARLAPPKILLWDGDMNLRGEVAGWRDVDYEFIENDTGTCSLQLSLSHYLAQWVMNFKGRDKRNVIVTIDKQGTRWSGFMKSYKVVNTPGNDCYVEITFIHDYEQAKHIYCWANPFLISSVQFPKLWIIFGPAKWCLLMTLFVNILRLETSLWTLPDNPLDIKQWFPFSLLDTAEWRNIVKPFPFLLDNSNLSIVFARFQAWHDVAKPVLEDAQLTVVCRRYLPSQGDPHPFSDLAGELNISFIEELASLIPLREGCLVWDIVDNSGWGTQTAFGGSLLTGLVRAVVNIADDGITEGVDVFTGSPTYPNEYYTPFFLGTSPTSPWVVFDAASPWTGVSSSEFTYNEATDTSFLTGGHSMPGVNEAISAGINAAGDFLTALMNDAIDSALNAGPFSGGFIQVPPLGGVLDAIAKILYEDVFLAFDQTETNRAIGSTIPLAGLEDTLTGLGAFHFFEGWGDGADRANTLAAIMATRAKIWETRVFTTHTIKIADAAPYYAGDNGQGDYWIGTRVGTTVPNFPIPYTVFIDRVQKMRYGWGKDGSRGWLATIGSPQQLDPALKALNEIKMINTAAGTLGIL